MTKWKCDRANAMCFKPCYAEIEGYEGMPLKCLFGDARTPKWERVPEESEQKSETTLPDWCKVGEWVYSIPAQKYDKIIAIQDFRIVTREMKYTDDYIDDGNVVQARLRPYNAKEMRGLVGKVLEHDGNASLVIVYLGNGLLRVGTKWVSAERLIEDGYTIDGKPCGKFEHLEDGEWKE
ncbi:MAG: hypothetical protein J6T08_08820 [Lentisphaeria bacterium]|nr:hypothetical protein [Lentisphaeria bacterium]